MKQFLVILATLILIAIALVVFARKGQQFNSLNSRADLIRADDGLVYVIEYLDQRIVVLLPKEWDNITSRMSTNSRTQSLDADVDLFASGGSPRVNIQFHSSNRNMILIGDQPFDLSRGGVFLVQAEEDSSGAKKIIQAPFKPLNASRAYLTTLNEELKDKLDK